MSRTFSKKEFSHKLYLNIVLTALKNICFGYLLELPLWGNSNKYLKHMLYEEIRTKQDISYNLLIKYSVQQQIHFNGNVSGSKWFEGSLYQTTLKMK